jgi:hypothetical protein
VLFRSVEVQDGIIKLSNQGAANSFDVLMRDQSGAFNDIAWDVHSAVGSFLNGGAITNVASKDGVSTIQLNPQGLGADQYELKITSTETGPGLETPIVREHTFKVSVAL